MAFTQEIYLHKRFVTVVNEHMVNDNLVIKPLDLTMLIMSSIDVGEIMNGPVLSVVLGFSLCSNVVVIVLT